MRGPLLGGQRPVEVRRNARFCALLLVEGGLQIAVEIGADEGMKAFLGVFIKPSA